jgi:hypothetical protein
MYKQTNKVVLCTSLKDIAAQQLRIFDTMTKLSTKLNIVNNSVTNITLEQSKQYNYNKTAAFYALNLKQTIIKLDFFMQYL